MCNVDDDDPLDPKETNSALNSRPVLRVVQPDPVSTTGKKSRIKRAGAKRDPEARPFRNAVDVHIGVQIEKRRNQLNLSLRSVSETLDISVELLDSIEKGARRAGPRQLTEIARVLETSAASFFEGFDFADARKREATLGRDAPVAKRATLAFETRMLTQLFQKIVDPRERLRIIQLVAEVARLGERQP
jgi:transcriptional regulator with XRE-family HTH domain